MEIFSDDLTDGGRAAWQALQSALSSWTAAGDGTVYESGGLSLWVPEGWADMAVVTAEDGHRPVNSDQKKRAAETPAALFCAHWARNTRFRSVMKLGILYTTQMASMPFSAAYWAGGIR